MKDQDYAAHAPWLKTIREAVGDDLPRLVYADFLDDLGLNVRADFIRFTVEFARKRAGCPECRKVPASCCNECYKHANESYRMLKAGGYDWLPPGASRLMVEWDRGFLYSATGTLGVWLGRHCESVGAAVAKWHAIEVVTITDLPVIHSGPGMEGRVALAGSMDIYADEGRRVPWQQWSEFYALLPNGREDGGHKSYTNDHALRQAVSSAAVAWALKQAEPSAEQPKPARRKKAKK